jgi:hypothetical protein
MEAELKASINKIQETVDGTRETRGTLEELMLQMCVELTWRKHHTTTFSSRYHASQKTIRQIKKEAKELYQAILADPSLTKRGGELSLR